VTPRWLIACITAVVGATAALSISWVGLCTFVIGPQVFQAALAGKIKTEPRVCDNVEDRAIQVLTGLLATLLALATNTIGSTRRDPRADWEDGPPTEPPAGP